MTDIIMTPEERKERASKEIQKILNEYNLTIVLQMALVDKSDQAK